MATPGTPQPNLPGKLPGAAGYLGWSGRAAANQMNNQFGQMNEGLDWITGGSGGPTSSPLYQSFLTKSRSAIGNSYDNAIINARANASSRGFGYASPNEGEAEAGIRGQEASQLGQAPSTALQETMPYEMEAEGLRLGEANTQENLASNEFNMYNQDENQIYQQQQQNKRQLYSSLATLAGTILGGPIGADIGASLFPSQNTTQQ